MKHLFLMDPLASIHLEKDTTYALMKAAYAQGHQIAVAGQSDLSVEMDQVMIKVTKIELKTEPSPFHVLGEAVVDASEFDVIWVRWDPPFDGVYLHNMWVLDLVAEKSHIFNHPNGIRTVSEKLWALQFKDLIPETVITASKAVFKAYLSKWKRVVIKPTDGFGGQGVFKLGEQDSNWAVAFEAVSEGETKAVVIQPYLKAAEEGDKRILLWHGEPLGAVLRVHNKNDHRNNLFAGGGTQAATLTDRDLEIVDRLRPKLNELGLAFVGLDILGDRLIEVNVTSPTCLQEMSRHNQTDYANQIIQSLS